MEKITLKPAVKELFYKNGEANVYFDILSCQGSTNQEKNLGSLFIVSQVKYSTGDLSYMVSLISSLAKREFYSATSVQEQNPKEAFSRTLKKLNEVLEEFFQNKDFKLNIGLVAITGENIFISRLGKFKINLARNDQFIDILNNVDLFSKDTAGEKQFSNIISGKLQQNDKLFAFFPTRSITSREKQLNDVFLKGGQEEFQQKIAALASNANNFSCCGVHIDMRQLKEIPLRPAPKYSIPLASPVSAASMGLKTEPPSFNTVAPQPIKSRAKDEDVESEENEEAPLEPEEDETESDDELSPAEQPRIIPAELSITRRDGFFTPLAAQFNKLRFLSRISNKAKLGIFVSLAAIVIAIPVFLIFLKGSDQSNGTISLANDNLKLAQSRISQSNVKDARSLLQAALFNLSALSNKKAENVRNQISQVLAGLDRVSDKQPVVDETADGSKIFASIVPKALAGIATDKNSALYEGNLYVLAETGMTIYKYVDAANGKTAQTTWGPLESRAVAIAVDGNIYALNDAGKLIKYYKGKKESEFDLQLSPSADGRIFTAKDSAFIYLSDKTNKKVYVFDKASGELKTSYDLAAAGQIQDIFVSPAGAVWILSADNKVWSIK